MGGGDDGRDGGDDDGDGGDDLCPNGTPVVRLSGRLSGFVSKWCA